MIFLSLRAQGHPELATLKTTHYQHLMESGQEERAGKMKEREGDLPGAVSLYMKAGLPGKAAKLISQHQVWGINQKHVEASKKIFKLHFNTVFL